MIIAETDHLVLRRYTPDDLDDLAALSCRTAASMSM
jgi:hypothetical protein